MLLVYSGIAIIAVALLTKQWYAFFWILVGLYLVLLGMGSSLPSTTKKVFLSPLLNPKKKIIVYALLVIIGAVLLDFILRY